MTRRNGWRCGDEAEGEAPLRSEQTSASQRPMAAAPPVALGLGLALGLALVLGADAAAAQSEAETNAPAAPGQSQTEPGASGAEELESGAPASADPNAEIFFTGDAWRALVTGKTLYYATSEGLVGREYYPPGGQRAVFEYAGDRSCFEGSWREADGVFCFNYDGEHCFFHLRRGDMIIARQMNGVDQQVVKITEETLSCAAGLTS